MFGGCSVSCLIIEYAAIERFFRSCAVSIAMQQSIEIKWVEYKDSAVLNAAYTIMFWKEGPGWAEVDIKTVSQMETKIEQMTDQYVQGFFRKLHEQGFTAASQYVSNMHKIKLGAQDAINEAFRSTREINSEVNAKITVAIQRAAEVKLGAAVGVALISGTAGVLAVAGTGSALVGASPLVFAAVGFGNSATHSIIKTWENGNSAKAVAVDFGKTALDQGSGKVSEVIGARATTNLATKEMARRNAEVAVRRYSDILGRRSTTVANVGKRTNQFAQAQTSLGQAQASASRAAVGKGVAQGVGYALPVVFAAWDILNAVKEYDETMKGL